MKKREVPSKTTPYLQLGKEKEQKYSSDGGKTEFQRFRAHPSAALK